MGILEKMAASSCTVTVAGEEIVLHYPNAAQKAEVMAMMPDAREDAVGETIGAWNALSAKALSVCVQGHDQMSEDDWSKVISASNDVPDEYEGLAELVSRALSMCGLKTDVRKENDPAQTVSDKVGEVPLQ